MKPDLQAMFLSLVYVLPSVQSIFCGLSGTGDNRYMAPENKVSYSLTMTFLFSLFSLLLDY